MSQMIISPIEEAINIIEADRNKINEINNLIKSKKNFLNNISKNLTEIEFDLKVVSNLINKFNNIYNKKKKDIIAFESQKKEYTNTFNSLNNEIDKLKNEIQSSKNENSKLKLVIKNYEENEKKNNFPSPQRCHYNYDESLLHNDSPYAEITANLYDSPKLHFDYSKFLDKNNINNEKSLTQRNNINNIGFENSYYSKNENKTKNYGDNLDINIEDSGKINENGIKNMNNKEINGKIDKIQKIVDEVFSDETVLNEVKRYLGSDVEEKLLNADVTEEYLSKIELVLELIDQKKNKDKDPFSKMNNIENFLNNKAQSERSNNKQKTKKYYSK